ncbi:hypothetical protein [Bacillus atrophaeus]|uniref:hypothetical protein n=1 Tax=Bacillus atrophaeus TaxID=1452 RepID=UPI00116C897A|nr:hypothetical protein BAT02nite_34510 [Bacillus atrophaeus]
MHESHIKNYIVPSIGHRRLDQIKTMHIVDFMDSLEKDGIRKDGKSGGLSSSTRYDVFKVLKAWKLIKVDPTEDLDPLKPKKCNFMIQKQLRNALKLFIRLI